MKRYELVITECAKCGVVHTDCDGLAAIGSIEGPTGEWVEYDEVQAEIAALKARVEELERAYAELHRWHTADATIRTGVEQAAVAFLEHHVEAHPRSRVYCPRCVQLRDERAREAAKGTT